MDDDFEILRGERRSFFCSNRLWKELLNHLKDCMPVSSYIRQAILEKMIRDEPKKEDYFREML